MGKLESNKLQKRTSLLNTAFNLFTTKGVSKTSIAEISKNAGIATKYNKKQENDHQQDC